MKSIAMKTICAFARRRCVAELLRDRRGIAATEFAVIVPLMLVMFFGTVEFSSGVAVDRKVYADGANARRSDLAVDLGHRQRLHNFFSAQHGDHDAVLSRDADANRDPRSRSSMSIPPRRRAGAMEPRIRRLGRSSSRSVAGIPTARSRSASFEPIFDLQRGQLSLYVPTIGYVMAKAGVNLSDVAYTRPRQSICVFYPPSTTATRLVRPRDADRRRERSVA